MEYITPIKTITSVICGLNNFKKCALEAHITPVVTLTSVICGLNNFKKCGLEEHITSVSHPNQCNMCPHT